jgi:hypothetical protein
MRPGLSWRDGDYTARADWPCFVELFRSESKLLFQLDTATHKGILNVVPRLAMMLLAKNRVFGKFGPATCALCVFLVRRSNA